MLIFTMFLGACRIRNSTPYFAYLASCGSCVQFHARLSDCSPMLVIPFEHAFKEASPKVRPRIVGSHSQVLGWMMMESSCIKDEGFVRGGSGSGFWAKTLHGSLLLSPQASTVS